MATTTSLELKVSAYFICNLTAPDTPKWIGPQFFAGCCKKPSHLGSTYGTLSDCPCISAKSSTVTYSLSNFTLSSSRKDPLPNYVAFKVLISQASWHASVWSMMHIKKLVTFIKSQDMKINGLTLTQETSCIL